jgi:ribosomal protein L7/L12
MPTSYECKECDLEFSVGWFHYHSFESGYESKNLLACNLCGTQHAIEIALTDRGSEYHEVFQVVVEKMSKEGFNEVVQQLRRHRKMSLMEAKDYVINTPFILIDRATDSHVYRMCPQLRELGVEVSYRVIERIKNPGFGKIQKDRLLYFPGPKLKNKDLDWIISDLNSEMLREGLLNIPCQKCGHKNCLIDDEIDSYKCPNCNKNGLTLASQWIT